MSLLFNMLLRFVIAFLPRSNCFNFMAAVTICNDFGAQENKICHCFHFSLLYLPLSDGTGCHDLSFMNIFKVSSQLFSLSSFTLIKRLFSSSSLSAIKVVSSAYLRLLFLLAVLTAACDSFSPVFCMMHSAYPLNKQGVCQYTGCQLSFPNLEPVRCSMSSSNCCFLSCILISQGTGKVVWYPYLFKNFL